MDTETTNHISKSFLHALGVLIYVTLVAYIMTNAEQWFGQMEQKSILGPIAFLMLFVTSAAVVGLLVFLKPVMMYLDGQKKRAVQLALGTVGWIAVLTLLIMVGVASLG